MFADIVVNLETLTITEDILFIIAELDEFKGAWRALGRLAPERLSALRHVATIESIGSSTRIEGSKLSDREVEKLLSKLKINSFRTRDEQEVAGYAAVIPGFDSFFYLPNQSATVCNHIVRSLLRVMCVLFTPSSILDRSSVIRSGSS